LEDPQALPRWKKDSAGQAYDLIHGLHAFHMAMFFRRFPELLPVPFLLTMTGTDLHRLREGQDIEIILPVLNQADHIVVFNENFISFLVDLIPSVRNKISVIRQGVDLSHGKPWSRADLLLSEDDFVFILPSGLRPIKNLDLATGAFDILRQSHAKAKLLIAGAAIEPDYAKSLLTRIEAIEGIFYLGEIEHRNMQQLYLMADAVINCSRAEGQPQAALEAMSLGKPCILTAVPGNWSIITDYQEGIYIKDEPEMVAAMDFLVTQSLRRQEMGKAASALVEKNFSLEGELQAYFDLYSAMIRSSL
jgi:glycosyltransferase involved in cell wall biosynthesis